MAVPMAVQSSMVSMFSGRASPMTWGHTITAVLPVGPWALSPDSNAATRSTANPRPAGTCALLSVSAARTRSRSLFRPASVSVTNTSYSLPDASCTTAWLMSQDTSAGATWFTPRTPDTTMFGMAAEANAANWNLLR